MLMSCVVCDHASSSSGAAVTRGTIHNSEQPTGFDSCGSLTEAPSSGKGVKCTRVVRAIHIRDRKPKCATPICYLSLHLLRNTDALLTRLAPGESTMTRWPAHPTVTHAILQCSALPDLLHARHRSLQCVTLMRKRVASTHSSAGRR